MDHGEDPELPHAESSSFFGIHGRLHELQEPEEQEDSSSTNESQKSASRLASRMKDLNIAALRELGLEVGAPVAQARLDERGFILDGDEGTRIMTNLFGLRTPNTLCFCYRIEFYRKNRTMPGAVVDDKLFPIFDDSGNLKMGDYFLHNRRLMRFRILREVLKQNESMFGSLDNYAYDMSFGLFSLKTLQLPGTSFEFRLDIERSTERFNFTFDVVVRFRSASVLTLNFRDFTGFSNNFDDINMSVISALDLATSHYPSTYPEEFVMFNNNKVYLMNPGNYGYTERDLPSLGRAKYVSGGPSKGVIAIEGPKGQKAVALSIDAARRPFWNTANLGELICMYYDKPVETVTFSDVSSMMPKLRRIVCFPTYGKMDRPITVHGFSQYSSSEQTFILEDGREITVEQYYRDRYNIQLRRPDWPLAVNKKRRDVFYYPVELLTVADNQRVAQGALEPDESRVFLSCAALAPYARLTEILQTVKVFNIENDGFCKASGLTMMDHPVALNCRRLARPMLQYANRGVMPEPDGRWRTPRNDRFVDPKGTATFVGAVVRSRNPNSRNQLTPNQFGEFLRHYVQRCQAFGMTLGMPSVVDYVEPTPDAIYNVMQFTSQNGASFVFFAQNDDDDPSVHQYIKTFEKETKVITQCMKNSNIIKVMNSNATLLIDNVILKSNCKLGGVNYDVKLPHRQFDKTVLFIGMAMNHPAGGYGAGNSTGYSVLGYAANDCAHPGNFVGNFVLQPLYRDEKITVIDDILRECIERFRQNRGMNPSRVIFYRNACSESRFGDILRYEVPIIKSTVASVGKCPVTIIVPSKSHSIRLFPEEINPGQRADAQNIRPGICVDRVITSPVFCEFFLNSHLAIKGSAKTPKYTVLCTTEEKLSLDTLQRWTDGLCHGFQIVNSPVSVPAPVYIAVRYAERGRVIVNNTKDLPMPNFGNDDVNASAEEIEGRSSPSNMKSFFNERSKQLNYNDTELLRNRRINA